MRSTTGELELLGSLLARTIGLGALLIATVLAYGTARIVGVKDNYRILEVAVGTAIILGPLFFWKGALTETFSAQPLTLLAYVEAMFVFWPLQSICWTNSRSRPISASVLFRRFRSSGKKRPSNSGHFS